MSDAVLITQSMMMLGGLGLAVGIMLLVAAKKFSVEVDPAVEEIVGVLPGANCGACGFAGCGDFAEKVVHENIAISGCPVGGFDVAKQIGGILGQVVEESEPEYPFVRCNGGIHCIDRFEYSGIQDCKAVMQLSDGEKGCNYGCMGRGSCVRACPFGAIIIDDTRLPVINKNLCKSCGLCIDVCPNQILVFSKTSEKEHIRCRSHDKGKFVKSVCEFGCIGCKRCVKVCPVDAIDFDKFLAEIDQEKCIKCGKCVDVCPQNTIEKR